MRNFIMAGVARALAASPRLVGWLLERAQRTPYQHLPGYMNRWWLFNPYDQETHTPKYRWIPFSIRFHHILREDTAQHMHDHPWNARTIILDGWYFERRQDCTVRWRKPGDTAVLKFGEYHHVEQVSPGGVLTLFITFRYGGDWGFLVDGKKVPWREYLSRGARE